MAPFESGTGMWRFLSYVAERAPMADHHHRCQGKPDRSILAQTLRIAADEVELAEQRGEQILAIEAGPLSAELIVQEQPDRQYEPALGVSIFTDSRHRCPIVIVGEEL